MRLRKLYREKLYKVKKWRENQSDFVEIFVSVLKYLGLWTDKRSKYGRRSLLGTALTLAWVVGLCPFYMTIAFVSSYKNLAAGDTIMNVLEPAMTGSVMAVFLLYVGVFTTRGPRFGAAVDALGRMLAAGRHLAEQPDAILGANKKMAELCVLYYIGGLAPFVFAGASMFGLAYVTKKFVFKAWFPFDFQAHPYFDLTSLGINVTIVTGFNLFLVANGFLLLHLVHAIGQFKLLNYNLGRLNMLAHAPLPCEHVQDKKQVLQALLDRRREIIRRRSNRSRRVGHHRASSGGFEERPTPRKHEAVYASKFGVVVKHAHLRESQPIAVEELERRFRLCIQHHQAIIMFVRKFQAAFSLLIANQFVLSVAPTILSIVLVTSMKELDVKLILFALPLSASIFNQWLYCWLGQKITTQGDLIKDAIFASNWFETSPRFKRSMRIVIAMSNQPLVMRVGGTLALSLDSFYAVMKLSYTSYTSLKGVQGQILSPDEVNQQVDAVAVAAAIAQH